MATSTETLQHSLQDDMSVSNNATATLPAATQEQATQVAQVTTPANSAETAQESSYPPVDSTQAGEVTDAEPTVTESAETDSPAIVSESASKALEEIDATIANSENALEAVTTMVLTASDDGDVITLDEEIPNYQAVTSVLPILEIKPEDLTKRPALEEESLQPISGATAAPAVFGKSTGVSFLALWISLAVLAVFLVAALVF